MRQEWKGGGCEPTTVTWRGSSYVVIRRPTRLLGFWRRRHPQPHLLVGFAFASFTDDVCDSGALEERRRRFERWVGLVRTGLDTGRVRHPLLRAFLHTSAERGLPRRWVESYLESTQIDLGFPGFVDESDYQAYIDQLTWPFTMLTTGLVQPGGGDEQFARSCRLPADACQRRFLRRPGGGSAGGGNLYLPRQ
ncbi:squalene/phytoene synthase family protein [Streptomyces sp. NPDC002701]|uniref:squalene/phytoene synthase family protein n=1 Tax=Streptomyces sp. NPDC002701 TaxID=3364661 RepID=UPI00369BE4B5